MRKTTIAAIVLVSACVLAGGPASAAREDEVRAAAPRPEPYGTGSTTNHVLQAYAFEPQTPDDTGWLSNPPLFARFCADPTGCGTLLAPAMLPSGALLEALEAEACDFTTSAQLSVALRRIGPLESGSSLLANFGTGNIVAPGCAFYIASIVPPHTVNNDTNTYLVEVSTNAVSDLIRFKAVRLVYRLQVSDPPAVATFPTDVPTTHPFFRFVEALAAAGITGGCGPGAYCPDSPVTRGQMAVFLATALGLHFPN